MSEQVTAAVREVLPALRERAQEAEDRRRVPDESIKALQLAGVFKLLQPARYGGHEADPITFYETIRAIAGACGSTGWVSSVVGIHPWQLGLFPDEAQREVWGDDPDSRISSSYAPTGRAKLVDGGYELTGRWSFSSGCDHASWVFLGGVVTDEDGKQVDFCTFLLPRKDYVIEDVWDTVGLRGTGSNDVIVEKVYVPKYRALSFADTSKCVCPGQEVNTSPLYKLPFASLFSYAITTPIIGMATGAYNAHVEHMAARVRVSYKGERSNEDPFAKVRIAHAAGEIDAAWLQLKYNMTELMDLANRGERIPLPLRLRIRRDQVRGTGRAIEAIDLLFENSGGRALRTGTPIQRFWRDAHAGRVHAINDPERALAMFGNGEFGIPVQDAML
jgi:3-hydroxy-9,10-secoandrosta-1,3,5(10)-triene-9,17-dione monooxygenase